MPSESSKLEQQAFEKPADYHFYYSIHIGNEIERKMES